MKELTKNEIKSISGGDCETATSWGRAVGEFFKGLYIPVLPTMPAF